MFLIFALVIKNFILTLSLLLYNAKYMKRISFFYQTLEFNFHRFSKMFFWYKKTKILKE